MDKDNDNWFTHVISKHPTTPFTYQAHQCAGDINWKGCVGIVVDVAFPNFVIMQQSLKFAFLTTLKKGILLLL